MPRSSRDVRLVVGWGLVIIGLTSAAVLYTKLPEPEKVIADLFDYALFTVALGAVSVLYKLYTDGLDKARADAAEADQNLRDFSTEIIQLYTGFKAVRREIWTHSSFRGGEPVTLDAAVFWDQFTRLVELHHRMEELDWRFRLSQPFLGDDQDDIHGWVQTCEKFTDEALRASRHVIRNDDGTVTVPEGNALFDFLQYNVRGSDKGPASRVAKEFFQPMSRIRRRLRDRVNEGQMDDRDAD